MSTICLERRDIIVTFCLLREAERSLHRLLNPACDWRDFASYYDAARKCALHQALTSLQRRLHPQQAFPPSIEELVREVPEPGILRLLGGALFGRFRKSWKFSTVEIAFFAGAFDALLAILAGSQKPSDEQLIQSRRMMCNCELAIEARCPGLSELDEARKVAHFDQSPSLPARTVSEILRDVA